MAFGRLVQKWGILQKNMVYKLATTSTILQACARLHNFIIDQQLLQKAQDKGKDTGNDNEDDEDDELHIVPHIEHPSGMRYLPTLPEDDYEAIAGNSISQQAVLETIREMKHRRPKQNKLRNK